MSTQIVKPNTEVVPSSQRPLQYVANTSYEPVSLTKILTEMGLTGPRIPAAQLVDQSFIILRAKPFQSAYDEQAHAWFCVCTDVATGENFTTVLGGQAVVDVIDALAATGFEKPLVVTLRLVQGGRYGRYYVLD